MTFLRSSKTNIERCFILAEMLWRSCKSTNILNILPPHLMKPAFCPSCNHLPRNSSLDCLFRTLSPENWHGGVPVLNTTLDSHVFGGKSAPAGPIGYAAYLKFVLTDWSIQPYSINPNWLAGLKIQTH